MTLSGIERVFVFNDSEVNYLLPYIPGDRHHCHNKDVNLVVWSKIVIGVPLALGIGRNFLNYDQRVLEAAYRVTKSTSKLSSTVSCHISRLTHTAATRVLILMYPYETCV